MGKPFGGMGRVQKGHRGPGMWGVPHGTVAALNGGPVSRRMDRRVGNARVKDMELHGLGGPYAGG